MMTMFYTATIPSSERSTTHTRIWPLVITGAQAQHTFVLVDKMLELQVNTEQQGLMACLTIRFMKQASCCLPCVVIVCLLCPVCRDNRQNFRVGL